MRNARFVTLAAVSMVLTIGTATGAGRCTMVRFGPNGTEIRALLTALLLVAAGCTRVQVPQSYKGMSVTAIPQPTNSVRTYPVSAAYSRNGPHLTSQQRTWILKVSRSRNYRKLPLLFALVHGIKTPIVVYIDRPLLGGIHRGGHVIGEECQVWFDPVVGGVYAASQAACSLPTPKPVD